MTKIFRQDSIIPYKDGWLVIDKEAEIKKDNFPTFAFDNRDNVVRSISSVKTQNIGTPSASCDSHDCGSSVGNVCYSIPLERLKVIIASINIIIEGVPLIKILGEAEEYWDKVYRGKREPYFIAGYKANTKQFTEGDMRNAMQILSLCINKDELNGFNIDWIKAEENLQLYIKSLRTKTIKSVELEYEEWKPCLLGLSEKELREAKSTYSLKIHNPKENTIIPVKINYLLTL